MKPTILARALASRVLHVGSRKGDGDIGIYSTQDSGAIVTVVVNQSSRANCNFTMDTSKSVGLISTRQALFTRDVVPKQSMQIVNVLVPAGGGWRTSTAYKWVCGKMTEKHDPGIFCKGLHDPIKVSLT